MDEISHVMVHAVIAEDWTHESWPWQKFVAGLSDHIRHRAVGEGIQNFGVEVRRDVICPYQKIPQVNFVITQCDGSRVIHHPHKNRDEPLRVESSAGEALNCPALDRKAIIRAFRVATEWKCYRRWPACLHNVFQTVVLSLRNGRTHQV